MITPIEARIGFPKEASEFFEREYEKILQADGVTDIIKQAQSFCLDGNSKECNILLAKASDISGVHRYTLDMIFMLLSAEELRARFIEYGCNEKIFYDTMRDLTYKLHECYAAYGIWGTFVMFWYYRFFKPSLFALGRLQYEIKELPIEGYKGVLSRGDIVYSCHIPSSGPLDINEVYSSFKQAYEFFSPKLKDGILPIYCSSWLIYPPHAELFLKNSNLSRFYSLFDIVESESDVTNKDIFRVFGADYSRERFFELPETSTLQRSLKKYLLDGNNMGHGRGIILFDGEKIINK